MHMHNFTPALPLFEDIQLARLDRPRIGSSALQDFLVESADPVKRNLVLSEPQVAAEKAARRQEAKERAAMW